LTAPVRTNSANDGLDFVRQIAKSVRSRDEKLLEICRFLNTRFEAFDWVGFYLSDNAREELFLGPFVGAPTEHIRIPFGRGICGQAAVFLDTINISNVAAESNYLACSLDVRSEIVIPIVKDGLFYGELDIDSHRPARFGRSDQLFLEKVVENLIDLFR